MGGAVIAASNDAFFDKVRRVQTTYGAVPSAFDCWLTLRGIRTLHLRMRAHSENARAVAAFLSEHPRVQAVHYPGLAAEAAKAVGSAQMSGLRWQCFRFRLWADGNRLWRLLPNCGCSRELQVWAAPRV